MNVSAIFIKRSILAGVLPTFLALSAAAQVADNKAGQTTADTMQPTATHASFLFEKVYTPFGKPVSRAYNTSSVSTAKGSTLYHYNTPNIGNTFMGQMAGLYVKQNGSAPGNNDNPDLFVRGRQTFQDNTVTVLVDGFETNWSNLMPEEIESVTVLKDAAALALYGLNSANGAVLITTKQGTATGKTQVNFSSRFGIQSATVLPDFLGAGDYAELFNEGMVSDGKSISSGYFRNDTIVNFFKNGQQPYLYPNIDWYEEMLKKSSFSQDYALSFKGGKEDARYFVALGFADYQGLYDNTENKRVNNTNYEYRRFNVRTNFDVNITKWLASEIKLRATVVSKFFPNASENTLWRSMALFTPYPVNTPGGRWGGTQGYSDNPVASVVQKGYQSINDRTLDANVKVVGKLNFITEGLRAFGQVVFSNFYFDTYNKTRNYAYDELIPRYDLIVPGVTPPGVLPYDSVTRGSTDANFSITQGTGNQFNRTNVLAGLEYDRSFGQSSIYASAIYFQDLYRGNGSEMPFANQGVMGRVNYSYRQRYFAELGYSYAGSENFPEGSRFGFFPTLSAGWILTSESFVRKNNILNFLKLRGSYGLLGNDRVGSTGRFTYQQFYVSAGTFILGNALGINNGMFRQGALANPDVTWEKAYRANFGADAILFKKLDISADYFIENREDIFINPANQIPAIVGATYNSVNGGKTKSSGAEVEMTYTDHIGKVGISLTANTSFFKNEIVDIAEPPRPYDYLYAKGNPINQPFVLQAIGFFKDQADISASPQQLFGNVRPGDVKYKDVNGDGFVDDNDRTPLGNTTLPNWVYAFGGQVSYAGFDLQAFFQGAGGRTISLLDNGNIVPFLNGGVLVTPWVKDNYWTSTRGDAARFPRLTTEPNDNNYRASTLWQRDGSFLRLRVLELGYTLPAALTTRWKMNGLRFFVSGNNLVTWHKVDELQIDPEVNNQFVHPAMKSFNFGFNLKF